MSFLEKEHHIEFDFSKRRRRTGRKEERRKGKLPNQIRHDENAAIAVGTWKKRKSKKNDGTGK